jgi:hypothetical protein
MQPQPVMPTNFAPTPGVPNGFAPPMQAPPAQAPPLQAQPAVQAPPPVAPPVATPAAQQAPAVSVVPSLDDDDYDDLFESTVVVVRSTQTTPWLLIDIDETPFVLYRSNVLGRKPSGKGAPDDAQLVSLSDQSKVLSRTHALLEVDGDRLWVTDLGSTNGTEVLDARGRGTEIAADKRTEVPKDGSISLGGRIVSFKFQA